MSSILLVLVSYVLALAAWPVLAVLFLFARPVPGRYGARGRKGVAAPAQASAPSDRISIVILNWNGRDLLSDNLPSVVEAVQRAGMEDEVLVVDNGSTDGSVEFLREEFPTVRVLSLPHNRGFGEGNNAGVRAARHDLVLLLNNDMKVDPDFLAPLRRGFREPRVFAVSSQIFFQDPGKLREETGRTFAVFRRGWIEYGHGPMPETAGAEFLQVLWAGGGSSAFHRARFLELGGFDPLYSPAYVEDADLSYRAWQRGWVVLMAPASRVYHKHRATSGRRFTPLQVEQLVLRNQWLFLWKNLQDWSWLALHLWHLPALIRRRGDELGFATVGSFCQALKRWPSLWSARRRALRLRDDAEIFGRACSGVSFLAREPRVPGRDRLHILYATAYLPHLGRHAGAGRMYHLIRLLASRHWISLVTFVENAEERALAAQVAPFCHRLELVDRHPNPGARLFPYPPYDEFDSPEMRQAIQRVLAEEAVDVVHFEYAQMAVYANGFLGRPQLLTQQEVGFVSSYRHFRHLSRPLEKVKGLYDFLQVFAREMDLLSRVDKVVCVNDADASYLRGLVPASALEVIKTGVDLDYFRPREGPPEDPTCLLFVGTFRHYPNVDSMLYFCEQIFPLVRERIPRAHLQIVGSHAGPRIQALERRGGVRVPGFQEDLRPFYQRSAVFVVPMRLGAGIRGKILEAWAMEKAVVASSVAAAGLDGRHGEHLFVADDPREFANCIVRLLQDAVLRQRLGSAGRRLAEQNYSWERAAHQLEHLYWTQVAREP